MFLKNLFNRMLGRKRNTTKNLVANNASGNYRTATETYRSSSYDDYSTMNTVHNAMFYNSFIHSSNDNHNNNNSSHNHSHSEPSSHALPSSNSNDTWTHSASSSYDTGSSSSSSYDSGSSYSSYDSGSTSSDSSSSSW